MKNIYLIRHGKPAFPEGRHLCLGQTDLPLCAEGILQAKAAAELMRGRSFELFSSPLIRAVRTAEEFKFPFKILDGLKEYGTGVWDGLSFDEIKLRYPELYAARGRDKNLLPPGAESHEKALKRFTDTLSSACESSCADAAFVSHAGVMGLFLQHCCGYSEKPAYGQIIHLTYDNRQFCLKGELSHAKTNENHEGTAQFR